MAILLLLFLLISTSAYANIEGDALYALRRAVNDPKNVLESWDPTLVDPCTWFHVTCDSDNRVTRLDLGNAELSGNLVPELGKLERLEYLELYMNNFVGTIPAEIGGLKNLISLDLFHNNLTGFIPPSLSKLSNIRFMRLNGNNLTGRIPRDLTKLRNLKIIDVSNNDLCGTFPTWGSFSKLSQESFMNNPRLDCIAQGKVGSGFDVSSAVYESHRYVRFSPNVISSAQILGEPGGGGSSTPSMIDVMENTSSSHQNHRFQESPAHNPVRRHTCKSEPVLERTRATHGKPSSYN